MFDTKHLRTDAKNIKALTADRSEAPSQLARESQVKPLNAEKEQY